MTAKAFIQLIAERTTGKRCELCEYNNGIFCNHPNVAVNEKCRNCILPFGFEKKKKVIKNYKKVVDKQAGLW